MSECALNNGIIYLRGEVTFATVASLNQQLHLLVSSQVRALDCSQVTKVDSSITALMLVALRLAKVASINFSIIQLPVAVSRLVKLYELEECLQLST